MEKIAHFLTNSKSRIFSDFVFVFKGQQGNSKRQSHEEDCANFCGILFKESFFFLLDTFLDFRLEISQIFRWVFGKFKTPNFQSETK